MVGYSEKLISMKILIIGPSPFMQHDPGKIVYDFIVAASLENELLGCFYHHDFTKHPIDVKHSFAVNDKTIPSLWIDPSKENGAVIDVYDMIVEHNPEAIVSFGSFHEIDFVRASIETSGKNIIWYHVMTTSAHIHDRRFAESITSIDHIWSYSESQISNLINLCEVDTDKISLINHSCSYKNLSNASNLDVVFGGWNTEAYNMKSIFEALSGIDCSVKCLTNYYEYGDFDLESLSNQYLEGKNIYPLEFGSLFEKPRHEEWDSFIENSKVFIDMSMSQNRCSTLKRAYLSGAKCVIIDTPRHREIAKEFPGIILVKSNTFFSASGMKLYIPDHLELHLILASILQDKPKKVSKTLLYDQIILKEEKEFNNLLNKLIRIASSGRFLDLESIT